MLCNSCNEFHWWAWRDLLMNSSTHIMSFCHSSIKLIHKQVNWEAGEAHSWPNMNSPTGWGMQQHLPSHSMASGMCSPVPPGERQLGQCSPLPFQTFPTHLLRSCKVPAFAFVQVTAPTIWFSENGTKPLSINGPWSMCVIRRKSPQSSSWPHQAIIIISNHPKIQN